MKKILSKLRYIKSASEYYISYFIPHTLYSRYSHGFTLFELVLSVGILALFATLLLPVSQSLQNRNALEQAAQTVVLALRDAQTRAISGDWENSWGVYLDDGSVTVFRGNSYGAISSSNDERTFSPTVLVSGADEIIFEKLTGETDDAGTITLTGPDDETKTITVNAKGVVTSY